MIRRITMPIRSPELRALRGGYAEVHPDGVAFSAGYGASAEFDVDTMTGIVWVPNRPVDDTWTIYCDLSTAAKAELVSLARSFL